MRNAVALFLAIVMAISMVNIAFAVGDVTTIYVAATGNDTNDGTSGAPVKTLAAAKALAAAANDGNQDVRIEISEGTYCLNDTLILTAQDGGKNGHSVTYHGNGDVVVSSLAPIEDWQPYDTEKNIYRAAVAPDFNTRQLYVNGTKARRSRSISYEGNTYSHLDRTCELGVLARDNKEFYFYADEVMAWNNFEAVEMHLLTGWTDNLFRLKKYDDTQYFKSVTIDNGGTEGSVAAAAVKIREPESERIFNRAHPDITGTTRGYKSRSYYYFENAYEFIDEDNEWYLDKSDNFVYFKAPIGADVSQMRFEAPTLETLVKVSGTKSALAANITFENITFEGTTWLRPSIEGLVGGQACQYMLTSTLDNAVTAYHPESAFYAEYASNLTLSSCCFRNTGSTGVDFYEGVIDSRIDSCEVYNCAGNGISVAKFVQDENTEFHTAYNPSDKSEICKNVAVINNTVHDIGTEMEGAVAIGAGYPEQILVAGNEIYNAPYSGISVGFGWTSADNAMKNNIIYKNRIYKIGLVTCDYGAIYTLSKQPDSICARNYISDVGTMPWFDYEYSGMYFDEQTEGYLIEENVLTNIGSNAWGGGINFNGCAAKNTTKNNVITNDALTGDTLTIAEEAGVVSGRTYAQLLAEVEDYRNGVQNPERPYNASDYKVLREFTAIGAEAVGTVGSNPEYALDGDSTTVYVADIAKDTMADTYLLTELDGSTPISKIEVYKKSNVYNTSNEYWADWIMAVGCELQGSFDGETWEQIGVMETWPDEAQRKGDDTKQTVTLSEPKSYKYVRYIRTGWKPDAPNNYGVWYLGEAGSNRLHVADMKFYTYADCSKVNVINATATATDEGSDASYAVDGDGATTYTLSNQTTDTMAQQYLLLETGGTRNIDKIIVLRKYNACGETDDYSYWADWSIAVGCELQGSMDGASWETVAVMNTWPDNTGETDREIFTLANPKPYKYVRYIRTTFKSGNDYCVWRWRDTDGGNRLNVAEIELLSVKPQVNAVVTAQSATSITITATSNMDGEYMVFAATYSEDGKRITDAAAKVVELQSGIGEGVTLDIDTSAQTAVFVWDKGMAPVSDKIIR